MVTCGCALVMVSCFCSVVLAHMPMLGCACATVYTWLVLALGFSCAWLCMCNNLHLVGTCAWLLMCLVVHAHLFAVRWYLFLVNACVGLLPTLGCGLTSGCGHEAVLLVTLMDGGLWLHLGYRIMFALVVLL